MHTMVVLLLTSRAGDWLQCECVIGAMQCSWLCFDCGLVYQPVPLPCLDVSRPFCSTSCTKAQTELLPVETAS